MKKIFFATLLAASLATSAFAKETAKVSYRVERSFKSRFNNAEKVDWSVRKDFSKATFEVDGQKLEAFFDLNGDMIGISKAINITELPSEAKKMLAKKYAGYAIGEAIRFEGTEENAYYISAETASEKVVLKVSNNRNLSVYQSRKKT